MRVSSVIQRSVPPADKSGGGEFALIRRFFSDLGEGPAVRLGPGDDAAVLQLPAGDELVVSTDSQLADVHFPGDASASKIAYRAVATAASDLAAMGARPLGMTLALSLPDSADNWLPGCREGLARAAIDFALPLVGGDTTRGPLALTITVLGACAAGTALQRSGALVGDQVCVSGFLGDAAAGLALLQDRLNAELEPRDCLLERFWRPQPALPLGQALLGIATSAIDVSDGLLADAAHIARASGVQICIESEKLPLSPALLAAAGREQALRWALTGGDDYVLCFTLGSGIDPPPGCAVIGRVETGSGLLLDGAPAVGEGFNHF